MNKRFVYADVIAGTFKTGSSSVAKQRMQILKTEYTSDIKLILKISNAGYLEKISQNVKNLEPQGNQEWFLLKDYIIT